MSVAVNRVPMVWAGGTELGVPQLPSRSTRSQHYSAGDTMSSFNHPPYPSPVSPSQELPSSFLRTTNPYAQYSKPGTHTRDFTTPLDPVVRQASPPPRSVQADPSGSARSPTTSTILRAPNPEWLRRQIDFTYTPPPDTRQTALTTPTGTAADAKSVSIGPLTDSMTAAGNTVAASTEPVVTAIPTVASSTFTPAALVELPAPPVETPAATSVPAIPIPTPLSSVQGTELVVSPPMTPTPPGEAPASEITTSAAHLEATTTIIPDQQVLIEALMKAFAEQSPQGLPQAEPLTQPTENTIYPADSPGPRVSQTTQPQASVSPEVGGYRDDYAYRSPPETLEADEAAAWQDTLGPEITYAERRGHQKPKRRRSYDAEGDEDEWSDDSIGTMVGRTVRSWGSNALCAGKAFLSAVLAPEESHRRARQPYGDRDLRRRRSADFESAYPPREDPMIYHDHYTHSDSDVHYGRPPLPLSDWESERSWESGVSSASTRSGSQMSRAERKAMKRAEKARRKAEKKQQKLERKMSRSGSGSESRWYRRSGSSRRGSI